MPHRYRIIILSVLTALILSGCVEVTQDIWINADGSGRIQMDVAFSEAIIAWLGQSGQGNLDDMRRRWEEVEEDFLEYPAVTEVTTDVFSEAGFRHLAIDMTVSDMNEIGDILRPALLQPLDQGAASSISYETLNNGNVLFAEILDFSSMEDDSDEDEWGGLFAVMFANNYLTFTLHAPRIEDANGRISEDRKSVTWRLPMAEVLAGATDTYEMHAEISGMRSAINTQFIVGVVLVVLSVSTALFASVHFLRRRARASLSDPSPSGQ